MPEPQVKKRVRGWSGEGSPRALQGRDSTAEGAAALLVTRVPGFPGPRLCPGPSRAAKRVAEGRRLPLAWSASVWSTLMSQSPPTPSLSAAGGGGGQGVCPFFV